MTTSALSPITLDASELERIDRFVNVGLVHIEQLSALCRLLNRAQPDGEAYEQSEADLLTVVEGMLPLLDTVRISFEELRSSLTPVRTPIGDAWILAAEDAFHATVRMITAQCTRSVIVVPSTCIARVDWPAASFALRWSAFGRRAARAAPRIAVNRRQRSEHRCCWAS